MSKFKILVMHDIHKETENGTIGWAYWRRSQALKKYAPEDFDVDTCQTSEIPWRKVGNYDLIFNLEYCAPDPKKFRANGFKGRWVVSFNSDGNRRTERWKPVLHYADYVIVNNEHAWKHNGKAKKTCCISNGVDTEVFLRKVSISDRPQKCIFAGSSGVTKGKGFNEIFYPLEKILPEYGFETDFRPIDDINPTVVKPTKETVDWYNSASYCLIASESEGTPNLLTEAVSCGCIAISVPVGNILEWGEHQVNCMITKRTPESFLESLLFARDLRATMSNMGMGTIRNGWSYGEPGNRAKYYFQLFRRLIEDSPASIKPFTYSQIDWEEI